MKAKVVLTWLGLVMALLGMSLGAQEGFVRHDGGVAYILGGAFIMLCLSAMTFLSVWCVKEVVFVDSRYRFVSFLMAIFVVALLVGSMLLFFTIFPNSALTTAMLGGVLVGLCNPCESEEKRAKENSN